ncbi:MAG: AlkA N-terminal domain-containing protein [Microcoleaceae cyanobacterium]
MNLEPEICYRALQARDARFDGKFFTGVLTTGIYCRPICPAPIPKLENCTFFPSATAAHESGFRPCLRCQPEVAPNLRVDTGNAIVTQAMRLIAQGILDEISVQGLAEKLGTSDRHLRRLFTQHLGLSPVSFAQVRRILFAKKLLNETQLSITEIAFAAGFSSIRRFNEVMYKTYKRTPTELQKGKSQTTAGAASAVKLKLPYSPPYRWDAMLHFLGPRTISGVEVVIQDTYYRGIEIAGIYGVVSVQPASEQNHLLATIQLPNSQFSKPTVFSQVVERLRALFDLDADIAQIEADLCRDETLKPFIQMKPGVRIPGAWDGFETAVRAILGQQISVAAATRLAGRLVETYGEPLQLEVTDSVPSNLQRLFPKPETLATVNLAELGIFKSRANAISALAQVLVEQPDFFQQFQTLDDAVKALCKLPGIGEWTAHYIAMRILREPDAFPATDLWLLKSVVPGQKLTKQQLLEQAEAWRPWRAYAAMQLWMKDFVPAESEK